MVLHQIPVSWHSYIPRLEMILVTLERLRLRKLWNMGLELPDPVNVSFGNPMAVLNVIQELFC